MRTLALWILLIGVAYTQFAGSLSGYACGQQQLVQRCQCQSFCRPQQKTFSGYSNYPSQQGNYYQGGGYSSGYQSQGPDYRHLVRAHRPRIQRPTHRKKFHFDTLEESSDELPDFPESEELPAFPESEELPEFPESEELPEPPTSEEVTAAPTRSSTRSWENEDSWEQKFVGHKHLESEEDEFPEITSEEIDHSRLTSASQDRFETSAPRTPFGSSALNQGLGSGGSGGGGVGTGGGIGVHTGLGIGAPGVGGLGGGGGIFGISSGLGIGVPGVPGGIGVSSGLGIGK